MKTFEAEEYLPARFLLIILQLLSMDLSSSFNKENFGKKHNIEGRYRFFRFHDMLNEVWKNLGCLFRNVYND